MQQRRLSNLPRLILVHYSLLGGALAPGLQVGRKLAAVRRELVGFTDARVKLCTEVITGESACKLLHGSNT